MPATLLEQRDALAELDAELDLALIDVLDAAPRDPAELPVFLQEHAPGVVLSASALLAEKPQPTEHDVREAMAGNLCRCTGYEPIVKAVLSVAKKSGRKAAVRRKRS